MILWFYSCTCLTIPIAILYFLYCYSYFLYYSQRITESWGLEGTSGDHLVPPAKAGSPKAGCTGPCPSGFSVSLREGDSTTPLGSLFWCSVTLNVKNFFPHVQMELPMLQFVPVAPCPVAGQHWKASGPILLTRTLKIFVGIYKVPSQASLLQAKQAQLPQPFSHSFQKDCSRDYANSVHISYHTF